MEASIIPNGDHPTPSPPEDPARPSLRELDKRELGLDLVGRIRDHVPRESAAALGLNVVLGLVQGVSLLLLVPLLGLVGVDVGGGTLGVVGNLAVTGIDALGLPLTLPTVLGLFITLQVGFHGLRYANQVLSARIGNTLIRELRADLYDDVTRMEWVHFKQLRPSRIAHALTEETFRVGNGAYLLLTFAATLVVGLAYLAIALRIEPLLTLLVLALATPLLLIVTHYNKQIQHHGESLTTSMRDVYDTTLERLDAMKLVKIHGPQDRGPHAFANLIDDVANAQIGVATTRAKTSFALRTGVVLLLSVVVMAAMGPLSMSTGGLLFMLFLFAQMTPMLGQAQSQYQGVLEQLPALANLKDLEETAWEHREVGSNEADVQWTADLKSRVQLDDVTFSYIPSKPILDNVTLDIPVGEVTVIQGPSGSGKTTIAALVAGLLKPTEGQIRIDGEKLEEKNRLLWRKHVAYVPQQPVILNSDIRENLQWGKPEATEQEMREALDSAACGFVLDNPDFLDLKTGKNGRKLSGGERQRLSIAMALLRDPQLLILDEATSELDSQVQEKVLDKVSTVAKTRELAILLITHQESNPRKTASTGSAPDLLVQSEAHEGNTVNQTNRLTTDPEVRTSQEN